MIPPFLLVCRVARRLLAFPLENVVLTLRPLRVEPLADAPAGALGIAMVRGAPLAVFDPASLFGERTCDARRWVVVKTPGARRVALAVEEVVDVRSIPADRLRAVPALLCTSGARHLASIGTLDEGLAFVLSSTHFVDELLGERVAAATGKERE